jgi:pimeloyl-ACP methyl ester carboxylesterase
MSEIVAADVDLGDVRLHYLTAGSGDPVLLLHGWPYTSHQWRDVIPLLAPHHRIVAPDLRGLGDSSAPASGYEKYTLAEDVWRLCTSTLGIERAHVVGHSWSTSVLYTLAANHPGFVRTASFIGPPPPRTSFRYVGWNQTFAQLADLPEAMLAGKEDLYFGWHWDIFAHPNHPLPEQARREYLRTYSRPEHVKGAFEYYRALPADMAAHDEISRRKLEQPSLYISGGPRSTARSGEPWTGQGPMLMGIHQVDMFEIWQQLLDDVRDVVVDDAGYSVPEHQPAVLVRQLRDFWSSR